MRERVRERERGKKRIHEEENLARVYQNSASKRAFLSQLANYFPRIHAVLLHA